RVGQPGRPGRAVRELRRAARDLGFVGLRAVPWLRELPPDNRLYYPLYVTGVELGFPVSTQVGYTGPLKPSETGQPVPYLDRVALDFPETGHRRRAHRSPMDRRDDRRRMEPRQRRHRHFRLPVAFPPAAAGAFHEQLRPGQGHVRYQLAPAPA